MKAIVSEKGQVTIPMALRRRLGISAGTVIDFEAAEGRLVGEKRELSEDPVAAVTGIVKRARGVDDYLSRTRGPVE
ncbi:MAG: AbrB/MazE/SpoVT family DNA-binding domain-containing protein [Proteobacteria bacterium]|jgi:AbrB family looped-hinge helix DNA binding protein|nr:AbrB/MazE/SpoVT family DNA-binding domain-containing protein [Pseudomonadota bacterium]